MLLAALVALAVAQHWDIEKVDSAGWGDGVQMRWRPDGRLFLCYGDTFGTIRLASYDTTWHYESVPAEFRFLPRPQTHAFDISPSGKVGIAYQCSTGVRCIAETDSGWIEFAGCSSGARPMPAYRFDGTFSYIAYYGNSIINVWRDDTVWRFDTVAWFDMGSLQYWTNRALPDGTQVCSITADSQTLLMGGVFYCLRVGDSWTISEWSLMMHEWASAVGCDADTSDSIRLCYEVSGWYYGGFYYEWTRVDGGVDMSVLEIDAMNRPQIAYARPELYYTYGDSSGWHNQVVDERSVLALDMMLSESCQPIIAFANDSGVFLARGVDVAWQKEEQREPTTFGLWPTATIVGRVLHLPGSPSASSTSLLDMTGRWVADLHPGANDVSGLAPGVYFIREAQAQVQAQAVHKAVITR